MKNKSPYGQWFLEKISLNLLKHIFVFSVFLSFIKSSFSQTLIYGIENEIKDFNLTTSLDKNAFVLNELFSQSFYTKKTDGSLEPDLVESAQYKAAEWRFKLRESTYSNSKKVKCEDIVINLREAQKSKSILGLRLKDLASLRCQKNELIIKTYHSSSELMQRIGSMVRIYEPSTLKDKIPVGSGPFKILHQKGKDLILISNPYFKGEKNVSEIRFRTLRDPWLRDLALMSGNVDFLIENFSHARIRSFEKNSFLKVYRNPSNILHYIGFNQKRVSKQIRKHVQSLLLNSDLAKIFWGNDAEPTSSIFQNFFFKEEDFSKKSVKTLEVSCIADETNVQFLSLLAKELKLKGIDLKIRPLEFATFMNSINSLNFESYFFYVDASHIQNLEALLAAKGNRLGIENNHLDQLFMNFQKDLKKGELEKKIEEVNFKEAYILPLYKSKKILAMSQNVRIEQSARGFWRDLVGALK